MTKFSKELVEGSIEQVNQIFQCVSHEDLKKEFMLIVEELEGKAKSVKEAEALAAKLAKEAKAVKTKKAVKKKED